MENLHIPLLYLSLNILLQHTHQIQLHILVDFAVAGEGTAAFFVAAEGADEVRAFDLFVEVTDKAAAGQVGGCDFVERADFLLAGGWALTGLSFYQNLKNGHFRSPRCTR